MDRIVPYLGPIGLGALAAGALLRLFQPDQDQVWASFLIAGLILSVFYLGSRWREVMTLLGRRGTRYGANLTVLIVLVAGIVVAINYLANRHNKRWDLTAAKQFTLSDQTVKILESLERDLEFVVLDRRENAAAALDLLREYGYHSDRINVEVIDQEAEPARASQYKTETEANIAFGTIVIDGGNRQERITSAAEQDITNAIIKVLKEGKKTIYFVEGHGEKDLEEPSGEGASLIKAKLEESNYEVATFHPLGSMREGKIVFPEGATAMIVAGPKRDYLPAELETFRQYLAYGGKAIFLLDPTNQADTPNLVAFMKELGVDLGDNVVIDVSGVGQLFGFGPEVPLVASYGFHSITERMASLATVFPVVRTASSIEESPEGISVTELLHTSENSWAEEDLEGLASGIQLDEREMQGSLSLGVALTIEPKEEETPEANEADEASPSTPIEDSDETDAEGTGNDESESENEEEIEPQGRAVVVGDSDFMANSLIQAPIGNRDLFLNMVNWVAEDEDLISVRPREAEDRRVFMTAQQQRNVGYLSLLIIPAVVLMLGISVWWGRR
jgi:ABC-type uncharacterized transport system involved in gliding motility auxiliary subunit